MTYSRFIIIDHSAKRSGKHQDLRFKRPKDIMWDSFAIRKGIPLEPGIKVLAIKTRLHTEKEALFVGKIKEGYGAGLLKKFDDGYCQILKYSNYHIIIKFYGKVVKGVYHLLNTGLRDSKYNSTKFLLFKSKE